MLIYDEEEMDYYGDHLEDAIEEEKYLWSLDSVTGTVPIPYMVQTDIRPEIRKRIAEAISEYDQKTCVRYITNICENYQLLIFHHSLCIPQRKSIKMFFYRFEEQFSTPNGVYIFFKDSTKCSSAVGKKRGRGNGNGYKHIIRAGGCESFGNVVHELMHSLGEFYS